MPELRRGADSRPFLLIQHPKHQLRLTERRYEDGTTLLRLRNSPSVYMNLGNPLYPYTWQDWQSDFKSLVAATEAADKEWKEFQQRKDSDKPMKARAPGEVEEGKKISLRAPVTAIRLVEEDGSETFVGEVIVKGRSLRSVLEDGHGAELLSTAQAVNMKSIDEMVAWDVGFLIDPLYGGQNIMTCALNTILQTFFIPNLNGYYIRGAFFGDNIGSRRVFEKCGFEFHSFQKDGFEMPANKTGGKKGVMRDYVVMLYKSKDGDDAERAATPEEHAKGPANESTVEH